MYITLQVLGYVSGLNPDLLMLKILKIDITCFPALCSVWIDKDRIVCLETIK